MNDVFFLICDGLKGLPQVVSNVWPLTTVQSCIIHLIRTTFRLASRKNWDALRRDVKPIYTAVNADAARAALDDLADRWGAKYPAIIRLWDNAWAEFIGVPRLRRRDPQGAVQHERDRVPERPLPASGPRPRALPDRASRHEMPVPRHPIAGPHRPGQDTMDDALEASPQRVRHHLRRPVPGR